MASFHSDNEYILTTNDNSFASPLIYRQINSYLRSFAMSQSAKMSSIILLRVHTVGTSAEQLISFQSGLSAINTKYPFVFKNLIIQYLNNDIVRSNTMEPSDIIDWLLGGHIHVILGHIHQGIDLTENLKWNVRKIENEILRLKYHAGNPNGVHVHDPVLLQDKFNYLAAIKDFSLPTLKIPLKVGNYKELTAVVTKFCEENVSCPDDSRFNGYVLKVPYTTNKHYRRLPDVKDVISAVKKFRDLYVGVIPYVMLQAYLHDTVECKVVCFNGKALYEAPVGKCDRARGTKKGFKSLPQRLMFAELVLQRLKLVCPCIEQRSLIRVDIFWCTYLNKMVVNELESLEARFDASDRENLKEQFVRQFLCVYHGNRVVEVLSQYFTQTLEHLEYPKWPFS